MKIIKQKLLSNSDFKDNYAALSEQLGKIELICSQFEAIIESSFDGIYITDGEANTLKVNSAYEKITGLRRDDLIGKNMRDIVKSGTVSESGTLLVIKKKESVTIQQTFKNGKTVLISSNPVFDDDNNIRLVVTNVRDITELNELNNMLDKSNKITKKYESEIDSIRGQLLNHFRIITNNKRTLLEIEKAKKVSPMNVTILLLGETGTGKELFAKYIYENSNRYDKPFFKVNCAAIPADLIESQLFGYEKGSFTGASSKGKAGIFEAAYGGTVLLDEIGELPLDLQPKLLRVLQEKEITRIGGVESVIVDVRIIAATNKDLKEMVKRNTFREDLYYRLNVVPLTIPPLRERKDDIPLLVNEFLNELNQKYGLEKSIKNEVIEVLCKYNWPGNVRELKNIIERVILMCNSNIIGTEDLPIEFEIEMHKPEIGNFENGIDMNSILKKYEMSLINWAYNRHKNVRAAAKFLGIHPSTFVRKRQKGNIK
ncbi:MAG: sigma 54-interacting transcriptional regulator [Anaerolineaceae bacterium]